VPDLIISSIPVLQHLGVRGQALVLALVQAAEHRVGGVAHAGLQRQQARGQPADADLVLQELEDVAGDAVGRLVRRGEGGIAIGQVRLDDGHHLLGVDLQVAFADAAARVQHRDRTAVRRQRGAVVHVVHALEFQRVLAVHLQDHLVGQVQPGLVVPEGRRGDQPAVLAHARDFDDGHVQLAEEAEPDELRDVRQVDVDVLHLAGIDARAAGRVRLVGQAHLDAAHLGQRAIELGRGRRAGPHADAEGLPALVGRLDVAGQRRRDRLGVAGAGEAAHADVVAMVDEGGRLFGGHDLLAHASMEDAGGRGQQNRISVSNPPV
jgi:hypothetical protein